MQQRTLPDKIDVVDDELAEVLRSKSPAERIAIVANANRTARVLAAAGARYLHPDWNGSKIEAEVARRVSGGSA